MHSSRGSLFRQKGYWIKGAKIQKIAVAFANADGGEFVIGIADSGDEPDPAKRWVGQPTQEDFNEHIQTLTEITPTLPFRFSFLACPPRTGLVLHVQVDKSAQVHSTADKKVYVRVGAQSLPVASAEQITALAFSKGAKSFEDYVVPASRMELIVESAVIQSFLTDYSPKTDPVDFVVNQQLVDFKTWEPTVAGILLFSDQPAANMPRQCSIKMKTCQRVQTVQAFRSADVSLIHVTQPSREIIVFVLHLLANRRPSENRSSD